MTTGRRRAPEDHRGHHHADPDAAVAAALEPSAALARRLDHAFDEVEVAAVTVDPGTEGLDLLLHAPSPGRDDVTDPDPRRVLRLLGVHTLRLLVAEESARGARILPVPTLDALEALLARCTWGGTMCGGRYLDDPGDTDHWPAVPSLELTLGRGVGLHRLWWFADCTMDGGSGPADLHWEGHATFDRLVVLDAHGAVVEMEDFLDGRARWWQSLLGPAQPTGGMAREEIPAWRPWAGRVLPRH